MKTNKGILQNFIENYSKKDFERIKFNWNGKHGEEFIDSNYEFRNELIEYIITNLDKINIELIKDLYLEIAKFTREAWSVTKNFYLLGQELILRDYKNYLIDYLEGACQSMDAFLDSGRITISKELAAEISDYIKDRLKKETNERMRLLLEGPGLDRFTFLSKKEN